MGSSCQGLDPVLNYLQEGSCWVYNENDQISLMSAILSTNMCC